MSLMKKTITALAMAAGIGVCGDSTSVGGIESKVLIPFMVNIYSNHDSGAAPLKVSLYAMGMDDRTIVRYEWDFGDGGKPKIDKGTDMPVQKHTYLKPGEYNVQLRAVDEDSNQVSASKEIIVK